MDGFEITPEPKPKERPRWQPWESGWYRGLRRLVPEVDFVFLWE
jgi:hypothetical protein